MSARVRGVLFGLLVVLVVAGATAYALGELHRAGARADREPSVPSTAAAALPPGPRIVFRHTGLDAEYGVVAEAALRDPSGPRAFTGISCDRVDAGPRGASCLRTRRGVVTRYETILVDRRWDPIASYPVPGIPSRTRLSPDGSLVATTVFVSGHSYLAHGFSTATEIREVGGDSYGNLETFTLVLDGREAAPVDRNIWGVTFADDTTFYATVATGGQTYLARGDLDSRTLRTLAEGVECPSLSPDGSRIAFKQTVSDPDGGSHWAPAVLDLETGERLVLDGEDRGIDDQIVWLDQDTLLYGLPRPDEPGVSDVWSLDVVAGATPALFVPEASSPAIVR